MSPRYYYIIILKREVVIPLFISRIAIPTVRHTPPLSLEIVKEDQKEMKSSTVKITEGEMHLIHQEIDKLWIRVDKTLPII